MTKAEKRKKLTILVNSCDSYSDVWDFFFKAIKLQWPECPYGFVLNTQKKNYSYDGMPIKVHKWSKNRRKDRWGERYKETLKSIKTPYVLVFLDDFVLTKAPKNLEAIDKIVGYMDDNPNISVFYLNQYC